MLVQRVVDFLGISEIKDLHCLVYLQCVVLTYWNSFAPLACVRIRLFSSPMYLLYPIYFINLFQQSL